MRKPLTYRKKRLGLVDRSVKKYNLDNSPEDWSYRLFMSVDLQNSTIFKKNSYKNGVPENAEWAWVFEDFYRDFSDIFHTELNDYVDLQIPSIWKCLGDEIIFQVEITDSADVVKYVLSFRSAIESYNEKAKCGRNKPLQSQGTVWGAGFPIRNHCIEIPCSNNEKQKDFIGLDIDIGFRISKYSKPERLVISLPVAYILSLHNCENIRYYDEINAKGVDAEYPIFWLLSSTNPKTPGRLLLSPSPIDSIIVFCTNYFEKEDNSAYSKPFIKNDKSNKCAEIPQNMEIRKAENDRAETERKQGIIGISGEEPDISLNLGSKGKKNLNKLKQIENDF